MPRLPPDWLPQPGETHQQSEMPGGTAETEAETRRRSSIACRDSSTSSYTLPATSRSRQSSPVPAPDQTTRRPYTTACPKTSSRVVDDAPGGVHHQQRCTGLDQVVFVRLRFLLPTPCRKQRQPDSTYQEKPPSRCSRLRRPESTTAEDWEIPAPQSGGEKDQSREHRWSSTDTSL